MNEREPKGPNLKPNFRTPQQIDHFLAAVKGLHAKGGMTDQERDTANRNLYKAHLALRDQAPLN